MTREEAINALDIVEHMESFSILYEPGEPMNPTTVGELKEACRIAISALRVQSDTPPNDPLTLEELREMDGEPVCLDLGDGGEWALVRVQQGKAFFIHKNTICAPANILFECGGKAYRRKPEEGTA